MDDLIQQGVDALKAGNRDEARRLFSVAVNQNPNNERAWGWLYNVANNDKERIDCLKQVLRINPENEKVNQLLKSLTYRQPQLESQQPQVSRSIHRQVPPPVQKQALVNSKTVRPKSRNGLVILVGILVSIIFCVGGFFVLGLILNALNSNSQPVARILSAQDVFEVSAVDAVENQGYTVTSAVCEVVSPEHFQPTFNVNGTPTTLDMFQIVFHAFRVKNPTLSSDVVVLFASNHTAAQGIGQFFAVNEDAKRLFPDFADGSNLSYPITTNTVGAQSALTCAQQAGIPSTLQFSNFDVEVWRSQAINKFGPEQTYPDGSKDDYVRTALSICKQSGADRAQMITNLGTKYEGSFQQFVIETFCPHVSNN